jgi:hypothetical protein
MRAFGKHIQGEMANDSREVESFIQQHFTGVGRYQERALGARPPTCATSKASVVRVLSSMFDGVLAAQDASTHVDFVWAKLTLNKPYTWALATSVLHELKELGYHFDGADAEKLFIFRICDPDFSLEVRTCIFLVFYVRSVASKYAELQLLTFHA